MISSKRTLLYLDEVPLPVCTDLLEEAIDFLDVVANFNDYVEADNDTGKDDAQYACAANETICFT